MSNKTKASTSPEAKSITVGTRVDEATYQRLEAVATAGRRKIAAVLAICVDDYLPVLEKELGIKPGQPPKKTKQQIEVEKF